jgi:hypothetical protein
MRFKARAVLVVCTWTMLPLLISHIFDFPILTIVLVILSTRFNLAAFVLSLSITCISFSSCKFSCSQPATNGFNTLQTKMISSGFSLILSLLRSNRLVSKTSMSLVQFWTIEWHIMGMSFHVCSRFSVLFGFEFLWLFFVQKRETLWHYLQTLKKKNLMDLLTLIPWVLALFFNHHEAFWENKWKGSCAPIWLNKCVTLSKSSFTSFLRSRPTHPLVFIAFISW